LSSSVAAAAELLKRGADPNLKTREGDTALHFGTDPALLKLLLARGARVTLNKAGVSPYTLALWRQDQEMIRTFKGLSPPMGFFDAVLLSDLPAVKDWISRGESANAKFYNDIPILHAASTRSSPDVVRALLVAGAKVDAKAGFAERTALLEALIEEFEEPKTAGEEARRVGVVKALVDAGASVVVRDNRGRTPVTLAAKRNSLPLVKLLVEKGAYADEKELQDLALVAPQVSREIVELLKSRRK
jgi:ankyrin repeat protein